MNISAAGGSLAPLKLNSQHSILMARHLLNLQEQEGENAVALIQRAAPDAGTGKGTLVNRYA